MAGANFLKVLAALPLLQQLGVLSPAVMNQSFKILQSMKLTNSSLFTISNALCRRCQAQSTVAASVKRPAAVRHSLCGTACAIVTEF